MPPTFSIKDLSRLATKDMWWTRSRKIKTGKKNTNKYRNHKILHRGCDRTCVCANLPCVRGTREKCDKFYRLLISERWKPTRSSKLWNQPCLSLLLLPLSFTATKALSLCAFSKVSIKFPLHLTIQNVAPWVVSSGTV